MIMLTSILFKNSKDFYIFNFKLHAITHWQSLCHPNPNSLLVLDVQIFVLHEEELSCLLTEVDEGVGRLRRYVEVVPLPDGVETVVDDDTELPLQEEEDESGEAGVGDALAGVRLQSDEGGEVVGRPEGETLLDCLLWHPVSLTANVGPG